MGYLENGVLSDEIELRAMLGHEEDILSDDKLPMSRRLNEIILNCTERIGTVTDKELIRKTIPKLSTDDQTVILINLRAISVDNNYKYEIDCPSCNVPIEINLALDSLQVRPGQAKEVRVAEVTLPSGKKAKIRPLLIEDAARTESMKLEGEGRVSMSIWLRLVELDGNANPTLEDVKGLLYADRIYIREAFDQMEGGIETELPIRCDFCGKHFKSYLDIARIEFFSPRLH
jgi:hypothetical protein